MLAWVAAVGLLAACSSDDGAVGEGRDAPDPAPTAGESTTGLGDDAEEPTAEPLMPSGRLELSDAFLFNSSDDMTAACDRLPEDTGWDEAMFLFDAKLVSTREDLSLTQCVYFADAKGDDVRFTLEANTLPIRPLLPSGEPVEVVDAGTMHDYLLGEGFEIDADMAFAGGAEYAWARYQGDEAEVYFLGGTHVLHLLTQQWPHTREEFGMASTSYLGLG